MGLHPLLAQVALAVVETVELVLVELELQVWLTLAQAVAVAQTFLKEMVELVALE